MLQIRHDTSEPAQTVVAVSGQVDLASAPQLAKALAQAQDGDGTRIVVDLTGVDFLDSAGVRVLVEAAQEATQREQVLSVRGARSWVAKVLEITGVEELLRVVR